MAVVENPQRSPDVWFDDGTIILRAEDTLFRVYKGVLVKESALFRDMFSLPQPQTGTESYDGCLVLKLYDNPSHMKLFLLSIFSSYDFLITQCSCPDYATVLRIALRYQADGLRKRIISILQCIYPDTLAGYDRISRSGNQFTSTNLLHRLPPDDFESHIAIANVARDTDVEILLPAVMMRLLQREMTELISATQTRDLNAAPILKALPAVSALSRAHTFAILYGSKLRISDECRSVSHCYDVRRSMLDALERPEMVHVADPFALISFAPGMLPHNMCQSCCRTVQTSYESARKTAWEELPACFGLPDWETLRERAGRGGGGDKAPNKGATAETET